MKQLFFFLFLTIASGLQAQNNILWKPDSVSSTRFPKMQMLGDSANFLYIKGDTVSFHLHGKNVDEVFEKGRVYRWSDSLVNGMRNIHFYIIKRKKVFKGSLTVDIQQIAENKYKMRVRNAFESFDKTIYLSDIGNFPLIGKKKKVYNPSKK